MTIYQEKPFKPTYLYIKQHTVTGKLYFGKTIKNPEKYQGSGLHWKNHIKKHGKEYIVTLWFGLFVDIKEIQKFALDFSHEMNIVESNQWLNMIPEDGIGGGSLRGMDNPNYGKRGRKHSLETRNKISEVNRGERNGNYGSSGTFLGKTHSEDSLNKMRGQTRTPEYRENLSKALLGKIRSEESSRKQSESTKGVPKSDAMRQNLSRALTGKKHEIVKCPWCDKCGGLSSMKRWHFDNCKLKGNQIK